MGKITGIGEKLKTLLNIFGATNNIELKIKGIGKKTKNGRKNKETDKGKQCKVYSLAYGHVHCV